MAHFPGEIEVGAPAQGVGQKVAAAAAAQRQTLHLLGRLPPDLHGRHPENLLQRHDRLGGGGAAGPAADTPQTQRGAGVPTG